MRPYLSYLSYLFILLCDMCVLQSCKKKFRLRLPHLKKTTILL